LTAGETKESAIAEIADILKDIPHKIVIPEYDRISYKGTVFTQEKYYPTWKIPVDSPLLTGAAKTYRELFREEPIIDKWTFSTNGVAICGKHNIPSIGFGPGNEIFAHAPNERIPISDLVRASAFYAALPYFL